MRSMSAPHTTTVALLSHCAASEGKHTRPHSGGSAPSDGAMRAMSPCPAPCPAQSGDNSMLFWYERLFGPYVFAKKIVINDSDL